MTNTKVTIKYSNGSEREFVASDELEELINNGEMFSVTTMHSDMGMLEEMSVSKIYAGNPIGALGNMMMMKRNAEKLDETDVNKGIIIDILTTCIKFLADEVTSHQSGMSELQHPSMEKYLLSVIEYSRLQHIEAGVFLELWTDGDWEQIKMEFPDFELPKGLLSSDTENRYECSVINKHCDQYIVELNAEEKITDEKCTHPENLKGNCTHILCPLCTEGSEVH